MKRKHQLVSDSLKAKKQRLAPAPEPSEQEGPGAVDAALQYLVSLFPRKLFEDSLPPLILRHQIYSLIKDRTTVDRHLSQLKDEGCIRMFQHGFDSDTLVVAFTDSYKEKVLEFVSGKEFARTVQKFLDSVFTSCPDISFDKNRMLREFGFSDMEITQLVNAGVLTLRDAGSWWLAVPGAGRFVKCFIKGRKAVLSMIQKAKYKEVLLSDLQNRRAPSAVKLGLPYHIHDIIGAQLVECVPTSSGTFLRLADD
ncbi:serine/threonine-protein kinase 19 [Varanus komodoensis]|uniref:Serine/threonine kinase 19 n=1 Tax=Varanus komodoensis TaxID=61221 RepID=A0A8D2JIU9_VARKO|nr:serine/threonine-protein kinase 19 [Varanus komodoensis]XP_044275651.1 serine/threonine-protein kinase 19 [Varanus komodoensis]XP_044275652.1 serine/threonine-protein kinase 19 [Varanus komodoensis]XP_044275653.1 serine/threonine-protein kinase 19 [Varanus komodoensis]XP_044275654.1 serine/threonine-protein kinase 19 [Varanus komodoensis]